MRYIFVHGLGQNSSSWERTISLMNQTNKASQPDLFELLQGKEHTYNNLYLGLSKYIEQSSEPVTLVGLSLGAILALNYTIDHPDKVHSLVLIGAQYKMPKRLLQIQNIVFRFMPESTFQKLGSSKNDFIQLTKSMMELDFSKDLQRVKCKTLIVCGEKDRANKKAALKLAEEITHADLTIIPDVGHEVNTEDPEQLANILNESLKE